MLTLVKLGGSLITDKRVEASFRADMMKRIASELRTAQQNGQSLIVGHGSGSFGHFAAKRHNTINGVHTAAQWHGFAEVATVAAHLNHLVAMTLYEHDLPVWRIQPSASVLCENGIITRMALDPIQTALERGLMPLVYGDVALDSIRGGTIVSTETIFTFLVKNLPVQRILLLGEVDGVYDQNGDVITQITSKTIDTLSDVLGSSAGTDVTGGMYTKVRDMLALTKIRPGLHIRIMDGTQPDLLHRTLLGEETPGTLITSA